MVAPYVGAWIETYDTFDEENDNKSHPTWVRGLKQVGIDNLLRVPSASHPTWVRGLKQAGIDNLLRVPSSHPTWVRGLKLLS